MDKKEHYRQVFCDFKNLCASGRQDCSFGEFYHRHGVEVSKMRTIIGGEFQPIRTLPGYSASHSLGLRCLRVYQDFKRLCAEGRQPGTFSSYCRANGISYKQMDGYQRRNNLRVSGLPGFKGPTGVGLPHGEEVPFESVIFEEAGFLPADSVSAITVKVNGHVAVSFPSITDVDLIAKFIKKLGKEFGHVKS